MICVDAYKNLFISGNKESTNVSPCCLVKPKEIKNLDFYNNSYLTEIRAAFDANQWPEACASCQNAEAQGKPSRRIGSNQWYRDNGAYNQDIDLLRLDYWTGDLCNLACVICGPQNSSVWKQQLNIPINRRINSVNDFWTNLDLTKIKFVHFNGGEPLLSKEHVKFLHAFPNKEQVTLNYNTNGTILPGKELNDLWLQFKLVQLDFSIDDIGDRFEYQRWPAKWSEVSGNLKWYIENGNHNSIYAVNTTVGVLNRENLDNLRLWLDQNFKQTKFTDPIEQRKQSAHGNFSLDANIKSVCQRLDYLDSKRGTNWRQTFPELLR